MKDEYSDTYGKNAKYPARRYSYNLRLGKIKLHIRDCEDILNIGCASCDYDIDLMKIGKRMISLDLNREDLRIARSKDVDLILMNANALYLPMKVSMP
jgi:hypothetical protein